MITTQTQEAKISQITQNQKKNSHLSVYNDNSLQTPDFSLEQIQEIQNKQIRLAMNVWSRLKQSSGAWSKMYGNNLDENNTWFQLLMIKTPEQLKRGLNYSLMQPSQYPVTASMFNFHAVMGHVPKKFKIYEMLQKSNTDCKYVYWIKKHIPTAFFQSTNESIALGMLEETLQELYEYMNVNIDVPELPLAQSHNLIDQDTEKNREKEIIEREKNRLNLKNQLNVLRDYLENLEN